MLGGLSSAYPPETSIIHVVTPELSAVKPAQNQNREDY
jgi:hypothetical protein